MFNDNRGLLVLDDRTYQADIGGDRPAILYAVSAKTAAWTNEHDTEAALAQLNATGGMSLTIDIPIAWMKTPPVNPITVEIFGEEKKLRWIQVKSGHFVMFDLPETVRWEEKVTILEINKITKGILAATYGISIGHIGLSTAIVMPMPRIYRSSAWIL